MLISKATQWRQVNKRDRVNIPNEPAGRATYYMAGGQPEDLGKQLYEMEFHGDAVIGDVLMDIGTDRTEPHRPVYSSEEFDALVYKSKGVSIYSCKLGRENFKTI
ncbi:MAG: hypothetical protein ACOX4R_08430 [Lentihominibacter sp.]|jgi:hypothetical protein